MTTDRHATELTGLDGSNPLAFLAALGLLTLVSDTDEETSIEWIERGHWIPRLRCRLDRASLLAHLEQALATWRSEPVVGLEYPKGGSGPPARDLKPPPDIYLRFLSDLVTSAHGRIAEDTSPTRATTARRGLDLAAGFATNAGVDGNGNTKPTALHFTAGQQEFLTMAKELLEKTAVTDIEEALFGPWPYRSELPVLGWDSSDTRDYALRASDPSKGKTGIPGADTLALLGLAFVPVVPVGANAETTGWSGTWKFGTWTWCLWSVPLGRRAVRLLMGTADLASTSSDLRRARGIGPVFQSRVRRHEQGGYGSFLPARVVPPGDR